MANDPKNAHTKLQIRTWIEEAIKNARDPDPREKIRRTRKEKAKKVAQKYGL